jgi:tetratricopeptide (TPR) repeat protein
MTKLRALAAGLLIAVCARGTYAQTVVSGTVKDLSGHAIKGATVSVENRDQPSALATTTDRKGRFVVTSLAPGDWYFSVQAPGYEMVERRMTVGAEHRAMHFEVRLTPGAVPSSLGGMTGRQVQQRIDAAEASAARGDLDAAIATYNELLTRVPALTTAYLRVGALYERKHDTTAALAAYRRLAELDPANAKAREAIARLTQGGK